MKRYLQIFAFILALMLLLCACQSATITSEPEPVSIVTSAPEESAGAPAAQAEASAAPDVLTAAESFHALDREVFIRYITDDGYSFHQMLTDPSAYGLDSKSLSMTWGELSEEDTEAYGAECAVYLERLLAIARTELNERDQLSYDILQQYLEDASAENIYAYYYEPLTEYNGQHSGLPLALGLFEIDSEQDALDYLSLLEDVPRYLTQVLTYEQKRAELGLFMTEDALDKILDAIQDIIDARDSFYLIGTFNDSLDMLEGLNADTAEAYKERNRNSVTTTFIDAFQTLYNGLNALRGSCRAPAGLCALGDKGRSYFEYGLQQEGDNRLSAEETRELIEDELYYALAMYFEIADANPGVASQQIQLSSGDAQKDIDLLKTLTSQILFALPEHNLSISDFPEELQQQMSGAAYVIPSINDWQDNVILVNPSNTDSEQLLTLAHEGYPGHMFQYVYQRSLTDTGLMQRALHYGAYAEGWAQLASYLIATTQTAYNTAYSELSFYNDMILYVLLPGIISIYVNYYDYDKTDVSAYLTSLSLGDTGYVEYYYNLAVEQPFYIFNYATGYCQLAALLRDAEDTIGDSFDQRAFLKAYLDLGPAYFNIVQERMDVWIDENTPE